MNGYDEAFNKLVADIKAAGAAMPPLKVYAYGRRVQQAKELVKTRYRLKNGRVVKFTRLD